MYAQRCSQPFNAFCVDEHISNLVHFDSSTLDLRRGRIDPSGTSLPEVAILFALFTIYPSKLSPLVLSRSKCGDHVWNRLNVLYYVYSVVAVSPV